VLNLKPRSVEAGDKVTLTGRGFATTMDNRVLIGRAALVVSATRPSSWSWPPTWAQRGRPRSPSRLWALGPGLDALQVGAGSSATYRLRFFAAPADGLVAPAWRA
jgi:hypothetical protein